MRFDENGNKIPIGFEDELTSLINRFSIENSCHTPDFILAEYILGCLVAFKRATEERERWFGKGLRIGGLTEDVWAKYDGGKQAQLMAELKPKLDLKTPAINEVEG